MEHMDPDNLFLQRRLSGIIRQLNGIVKNLGDFKDENPHVIAPNLMDAMIGNLKDDINILLREMNIIGSPNRRQLQERRYVCRSCHNVFTSPLVAGICDECRSRGITSTEVAPPPAEEEETEEKDAQEGEERSASKNDAEISEASAEEESGAVSDGTSDETADAAESSTEEDPALDESVDSNPEDPFNKA